MNTFRRLFYIILISGALHFLGSCSDAGLQPLQSSVKKKFDNLLTVKGEYCVQPDTTVEFPVKVLLIIDQSASLQCTDPANRRFEALNRLVGDVLSNRSAQIGVIGFSSWTRYSPFTRDSGTIRGAIGEEQGGGVATDYQGALATALRAVENDILTAMTSDPGLPARSRYVIAFVSDGIPEPRCLAGCEDDRTNCEDGIDNDGDGLIDGSDDNCSNLGDNLLHPDNLYAICNYTGDPDSDDPENIRQVLEADEYVDFDMICPSYNEPELILQRVSDLIELQDTYSVGNVALHSVFLFAPQAEVTAVCGEVASTFGYDQNQARNLLQAMAAAGTGAFRDVNIHTAADNNFLQFDYRSLQKPLWTSSFMARNQYASLTRDGYEPDTDADGLGDALERNLGTKYKERDSDATPEVADGYSDLFELRYKKLGFDPTDPLQPAITCSEPSDLDGDGLLDCEETMIGTDTRRSDSDGDGILDWIEIVNGTDPTVADATQDLDFDGNSNLDEIRGGTNPQVPDADRFREQRIEYEWKDLGIRQITPSGSDQTRARSCAAFEARDIQLVTTPLVPDRGLNRIFIYESEQAAQLAGTRSSTYVACFEAFYRSETSKDPESGEIDVTGESWEKLLLKIQKQVDRLQKCPWFTGDNFSRPRIEGVIEQCLSDSIALGRFAYKRQDAIALLRHYVAENFAINLPMPSSELFVPIENFDAARDCYRPWELQYLFDLVERIREACDSCSDLDADASAPEGYLDAGAYEQWQEAGLPNPCCYTLSR
ncbi:MAG: VWA domain-containing protein [Deltaproteobacteria bacterium]|nr:VWA domain-containing protein [Deltaproteobacteria bacterium]